MERKCENCCHFAREYFGGRDCCTVDEDDDEGTIHWANADNEACGSWEFDWCADGEKKNE